MDLPGSKQRSGHASGDNVGGRITRSSTKRLGKERLGRRCAYAWECGAEKKSRMGERCRRRWWAQATAALERRS
jgi:hypothetical protein